MFLIKNIKFKFLKNKKRNFKFKGLKSKGFKFKKFKIYLSLNFNYFYPI